MIRRPPISTLFPSPTLSLPGRPLPASADPDGRHPGTFDRVPVRQDLNVACLTHAYPRWDGDVAGRVVRGASRSQQPTLKTTRLARHHTPTRNLPALCLINKLINSRS